MKKRKKSIKKERGNPKTIILLFGVPLLLILSLALLFDSSRFSKVENTKVEPYENDQFTESTFSAQTPEQLFQGAIGSPVPSAPILPTFTPTPTVTSVPTFTPVPTKQPTLTPVLGPCSLCQYKADLFWGPVIKSFVGGKTYTLPVNRLIASASSELTGNKWLPFCTLFPVSLVPLANEEQMMSECSDPLGKKFLAGSIDSSKASLPDGYMKGIITNSSKDCAYEVGLAVYKSAKNTGNPSEDTGKHNLYDYRMVSIKPGETAEIYIKTPMQNDSPACHKIPEPTIIALSTPAFTPTPIASGYDITVRSETNRNIFGINNNVRFSWEKFPDVADRISKIYVRRWDVEPPVVGREYKEYKLETNSVSFQNNGLKNDASYFYKYCVELKNYSKLVCTDMVEVKGGVPQELQARMIMPQDLDTQVLGVSSTGNSEEIFEERPGLLRIVVRWLFRGNR